MSDTLLRRRDSRSNREEFRRDSSGCVAAEPDWFRSFDELRRSRGIMVDVGEIAYHAESEREHAMLRSRRSWINVAIESSYCFHGDHWCGGYGKYSDRDLSSLHALRL